MSSKSVDNMRALASRLAVHLTGATVLAWIWKEVLDSPRETRFQRVVQFHLKCPATGSVEGSDSGEDSATMFTS